MSRRLFLGRFAALIGFSVVAPLAEPSETRQVELQRSPLAGFQYHQGDEVWPFLIVGTLLDLVREPDNAYDIRAVRVDWRGQKLGYVPRTDNAAISHLLDSGQLVTAEITALQLSEDPWDRIEFAVFLRC